MTRDLANNHRDGRLQVVLTLFGALALCLYWRSWQDLPHLIYDIPAALAVVAFIAELLLNGWRRCIDRAWWARLGLLAALTVITVGREFGGWPISGHLSGVLAVALVQATAPRLAGWQRLLYTVPVPIVLIIRWWWFDQGRHEQTGWAILFALVAAAPAMILQRGGETE